MVYGNIYGIYTVYDIPYMVCQNKLKKKKKKILRYFEEPKLLKISQAVEHAPLRERPGTGA